MIGKKRQEFWLHLQLTTYGIIQGLAQQRCGLVVGQAVDGEKLAVMVTKVKAPGRAPQGLALRVDRVV